MFFVYILQNPAGTFYVGHTENLPQRLQSHNDTGPNHGKFTRKNGPWVLVWSEEHPDRALAIARERLIKSMKSAWVSAARVAAAEEAKTASMFAQLARRMASGRLW